MGFGIRSFRKVEETSTNDNKKKFVKNVVIGESLAAVNKFYKLFTAGEEVVLVTTNKVTFDNLQKDLSVKVQQIRGEEQRELFLNLLGTPVESVMSKSPLFYKDGEFREFDSKIKLPMELREGEEHFSKPYYKTDLTNFIPCTEEFKKALEENQKVLDVIEIEKITPTDLVNINNFKIEFSDYSKAECENIYWSNSVKNFLKTTKNADDLEDAIHQYASQVIERSGLEVSFGLSKALVNHEETFFLPQSLTHEWGYFICEQINKDNKIILNVFCYIDENETSESELAKKIKLMKRVLARIFDDFNNSLIDEHIKFSSKVLCEINEESSFENSQFVDGFNIIGASYNDNRHNIGYGFVRELSSFL